MVRHINSRLKIILVVEDELSLHVALANSLKKAGRTAKNVGDGRSALESRRGEFIPHL